MHYTLTLTHPFARQGSVDIHGHVPAAADNPETLKGRAALALDAGGFSLLLRPTPAELRAMAELFQALALDLEVAAVPPYTGNRPRWPAGLTHLPTSPAADQSAAQASCKQQVTA